MAGRLEILPVADFVKALASGAPAPGAGAAGAVSLALGAACAAKAFHISARHDPDSGMADAADRARQIAEFALAGADWDAEDFRALLKAGSGDARLVKALAQDGEVMLALAAELKSLIGVHRAAVMPAMAGDLTAAATLVQAFEAIEGHNLDELKS